jgi:hypothetical protein
MASYQARQFDLSSCGFCSPPPVGPILNMICSRTYCNNLLVSVRGDGIPACKAVTLCASATVYTENSANHRQFDCNTCGGNTLNGSWDTLIGD